MTTMSPEDIAAIPVADWAADECVLALWATWPKLDEAMKLMETWGFEYVTGIPWVKVLPPDPCAQVGLFGEADIVKIKRGIGFWFQAASEMVLFGRRGGVTPGRTAELGLLCGERGQFYAPIGRHSKKPGCVQDYLEEYFPGPYLELFARYPREGWTSYGLELGYELGPWGVRMRATA